MTSDTALTQEKAERSNLGNMNSFSQGSYIALLAEEAVLLVAVASEHSRNVFVCAKVNVRMCPKNAILRVQRHQVPRVLCQPSKIL